MVIIDFTHCTFNLFNFLGLVFVNCHKSRVICYNGHWLQNDGNAWPIKAPAVFTCVRCVLYDICLPYEVSDCHSSLSFLWDSFLVAFLFFFSYQVATYSGYFITHQFLFILYCCSLFLSGVKCFGHMLEKCKRNWIRKQIRLSQSPRTNLQLSWLQWRQGEE